VLEHHVACPGIVVPAVVRLDVHRAQLPLADRIFDARPEAPLLLLLADLQPDLDEPGAAVDDELLDDGAKFEKALCSLDEQKPMTYSTPARLYQLRSKITISPPAGKRST
jgi:hypothetical protein